MKRVRTRSEAVAVLPDPVEPEVNLERLWENSPRFALELFTPLAGGTTFKVDGCGRGTNPVVIGVADMAMAFETTGLDGALALYYISMQYPDRRHAEEIATWLLPVICKQSKAKWWQVRNMIPPAMACFIYRGEPVDDDLAFRDCLAVIESRANAAAVVAKIRLG